MSLPERPAIKRLLAALRHLVRKGTFIDWAIAFLLLGVPSFFLQGVYRACLAALSKVLLPIAFYPLVRLTGVDSPREITWRGIQLFAVLIEFAQVMVAMVALWLTLKFLRSLLSS